MLGGFHFCSTNVVPMDMRIARRGVAHAKMKKQALKCSILQREKVLQLQSECTREYTRASETVAEHIGSTITTTKYCVKPQ